MSKLLPYETIVKAHEGDPEAVDAVLAHYSRYIRLLFQDKRTGQCRGGGLCEAAAHCQSIQISV